MRNKLARLSIPYVVWMALFVVAPIVMVVFYAFTADGGGFTFANFSSMGTYAVVFGRSFKLAAIATYPNPVSNVATIEAHVGRWFLVKWIGSITTRRFTRDLHLVKSIRKVLKRGDILAMYPEARYSIFGTLAYLPNSLGKLVKLNKVPVVVTNHHGNHLYAPCWNYRKKRKVPLHTQLRLILTPEQIKAMSVAEINEVIRRELDYDEYRYQKEQGIRITEPYRAEGLHKILYQCPHCKTEFQMDSKGTQVFCKACGKHWNWNEDGYLQAVEGETEFDHIPDWVDWERQQVRQQIMNGQYRFEDEVTVYSLPRIFWYIPLGKAKLTHTPEVGFTLEGFYRGQRYYIHREPAQTNSLHVEYDFSYLRKRDCVDISTENDSFYCCPSKPNQITKLAIATEVIYQNRNQ